MLLWALIPFLLVLAAGMAFFQFRSTPTHLVIKRRRRKALTHVDFTTRLAAEFVASAAAKEADFAKVRALEWSVYGRYFTAPDGSQIEEGDPAAHIQDAPPVRTPLSPYDPEHDRLVANTKAGRAAHDDGPRAVTKHGRASVGSFVQVGSGNVQINGMSAEDIADMPLQDFAQLRRDMMDMSQRLRKGMFG
jgi:hypothetical protein